MKSLKSGRQQADQDDECDDVERNRLAKLFGGAGCCGDEVEGVTEIDRAAQQEQTEFDAMFGSMLS